jgi:hypothetical protein
MHENDVSFHRIVAPELVRPPAGVTDPVLRGETQNVIVVDDIDALPISIEKLTVKVINGTGTFDGNFQDWQVKCPKVDEELTWVCQDTIDGFNRWCVTNCQSND